MAKNLTIDKEAVHTANNNITVYGDDDNGYVITVKTTDNTILAKNAYAALNATGKAADPTKTYDHTTKVLNSSGTALDATGYVTVTGLVNNESYNVAAAYEDANVAVTKDANGMATPQASANTVDYTVSANNYNVYTIDDSGKIFTYKNHVKEDTAYTYDAATGKIIENGTTELGTNKKLNELVTGTHDVLAGKGTINQKEITVDVTKAEKIYDAKEAINVNGDGLPTFTVEGLVSYQDGNNTVTETMVLKDANGYLTNDGKALLTGEYGTYGADGFTANGDVNYDETYVVGNKARDKAVQYSGLQKLLNKNQGTANADN